MGYLYFTTPNIIFSHEPEIIEINSKYDAMSFIKKVEHSDIKQVSVKDDKVNNKKAGHLSNIICNQRSNFCIRCTGKRHEKARSHNKTCFY